MIYILSDASRPLTFLTAGNLISEDRFLHPRRTIDSFEFISVTKGILHIQSDARSYHLSSGQFVLLPPGECHHGTVPSDGELSFYWTHFHNRLRQLSRRRTSLVISCPKPAHSPQTAGSISCSYSFLTSQSVSAPSLQCSAVMPRAHCCLS